MANGSMKMNDLKSRWVLNFTLALAFWELARAFDFFPPNQPIRITAESVLYFTIGVLLAVGAAGHANDKSIGTWLLIASTGAALIVEILHSWILLVGTQNDSVIFPHWFEVIANVVMPIGAAGVIAVLLFLPKNDMT